MTDSAAINEIMLALKKWTDEKVHSPSLLVSTDNGSFHVAYYAGMGSYDSVPIENSSPLYKSKIEQLFKNGELSVSGRAFTLYPGSDRFKKLIFKKKSS